VGSVIGVAGITVGGIGVGVFSGAGVSVATGSAGADSSIGSETATSTLEAVLEFISSDGSVVVPHPITRSDKTNMITKLNVFIFINSP
tara:strand:- start:929 stop:1192 length:264 start_codon:yes stop_codon:yes gene_type:complete